MQDFFDVSDEDLTIADKLIFQDKEIVKLTCTDLRQNAQNGSLQLKCKVHSGPHQGKETTIYLTSSDNEVSKKIKAQFLKAFWTVEQIKARQADPRKLMGRSFTARSRVQTKEKGTYQNWEQFEDLGIDGQAQAAQAPQPQPAPNGQQPATPAPQTAAQQTTF